MLAELAYLVPIASLILTLMLAIGGVFAFRGAINRSASEIQKNTIEALLVQNAAQERQIVTLEKKVQRLENVLYTLQTTLKKRRGLLIEINDDLITLVDQTGAEHTVQIHTTGQLEKVNKEDS
jgi:hypothetical protein